MEKEKRTKDMGRGRDSEIGGREREAIGKGERRRKRKKRDGKRDAGRERGSEIVSKIQLVEDG